MDVQLLTYLFVGSSFALYIGIAIWSRASSTDDFYVAGGGVHPVANGMATAADWMSAASFISMAGIIAFMGYDGTVYLMGWTGGYVLLALLLAPYLRKFGEYTVPDFIGTRYYSNAARAVAVICLIVVSFTYVAGQMRGVGIVVQGQVEVITHDGVGIDLHGEELCEVMYAFDEPLFAVVVVVSGDLIESAQETVSNTAGDQVVEQGYVWIDEVFAGGGHVPSMVDGGVQRRRHLLHGLWEISLYSPPSIQPP